ncbi:MAG: hypothetical protein HJJLKODD_01797 [Phycisphaerae bacterium]|nr:hypothetical protein [Phycisphaerae bacterium]
MAHDHHHHHDHDHDHDHIEPQVPFGEGRDSANESLAEALRSSFKVLKLIMLAVVLLYIFSGVIKVEQNQRAIVLRMGELHGDPLEPGAHFLFPKPIDVPIKIAVQERRTLTIDTQFLRPSAAEKDRKPSELTRSGGMDPKQDGALLTGDRGLIHAQWTITYQIKDLKKFVSNIYLAEDGAEERFIRTAIENAAIGVVGQRKASRVIREDVTAVQEEVQRLAQEELQHLDTGIDLVNVTVLTMAPLQIKGVFEEVSKAENEKQKMIDEARKDRDQYLNLAAGEAYNALEREFKDYFAARAAGDPVKVNAAYEEIKRIIMNEATGLAGEQIKEARSYKKNVLEDIRRESERFKSYLTEYRSNPQLLLARLWYNTQRDILMNPNVTKRYYPAGQKQIRLQISPDPKELEEQQTKQFQQKKETPGDFSNIKSDEKDVGRLNASRSQVLQ